VTGRSGRRKSPLGSGSYTSCSKLLIARESFPGRNRGSGILPEIQRGLCTPSKQFVPSLSDGEFLCLFIQALKRLATFAGSLRDRRCSGHNGFVTGGSGRRKSSLESGSYNSCSKLMIARGIFPRAEPWIGHFARDTAGSLHTIETIRPVATRRGIFMLIHPGVETPGTFAGSLRDRRCSVQNEFVAGGSGRRKSPLGSGSYTSCSKLLIARESFPGRNRGSGILPEIQRADRPGNLSTGGSCAKNGQLEKSTCIHG